MSPKPQGPEIIRGAHGEAAKHGAILAAEPLPLDEIKPPNAADTERGLAARKDRGRPFQPSNAAARDRPPTLCRSVAADVPDKLPPSKATPKADDIRRIMRRAEYMVAGRTRPSKKRARTFPSVPRAG